MPVALVVLVELAAARGNAIIPASAALRFVAPVRSNVAVVLQALQAGIHGSFFQLVQVVRQLVDQLGDFVSIFVAVRQELQDDRIRVPAQQIRR